MTFEDLQNETKIMLSDTCAHDIAIRVHVTIGQKNQESAHTGRWWSALTTF